MILFSCLISAAVACVMLLWLIGDLDPGPYDEGGAYKVTARPSSHRAVIDARSTTSRAMQGP